MAGKRKNNPAGSTNSYRGDVLRVLGALKVATADQIQRIGAPHLSFRHADKEPASKRKQARTASHTGALSDMRKHGLSENGGSTETGDSLRNLTLKGLQAASYGGAKVHDFRLWSRIYPATGREGYVPLAFVFTGKTEAQRASRMRRLEEAARRYFAGEPYSGRASGITAVDYHQAVPVVVTELERITADAEGAAGKVWRRLGREEDEWQTLAEALDNPDGDRLYAVQWKEARRRQEEREAAAREAKRPVCTRCGTKFTDERWQSIRQSSWRSEGDELCGPCLDEHHERVRAEKAARRLAEEAAVREAAEAEKKNRGLFRRRS
ncbi:hypothetical protein [Streptomyces enissocaesilis]|uniref:Uncharacterized protein n=1 Tax=Streptomyces enissocaesilis TaxID=332589 RepID=A0ABP6K757_9ACTN